MGFKFELGQGVKDLVTGFSGIISQRTEYLTGCARYGVQPKELDKDGKIKDAVYLDENSIVPFGKSITIVKPKGTEDKGGPQKDAPSRISKIS